MEKKQKRLAQPSRVEVEPPAPQERTVMPYELYVKRVDLQSERIMIALLERGAPFVEIQVNDQDAATLESLTGRKMPFVMRNSRVIGGFSDVVNHLRRPAGRQVPRVSC